MKKLIAPIVLGLSMLIASPTFAYTVKPGDTMSKIAVNNNMTLVELSQANPQVSNLNLISIGENINTTLISKSQAINVSQADKDLLEKLVEAEAGGEPYAGKVAVAYVVLNRAASGYFPSNIHDVIYQPGQFQPVSNGYIDQVTPSADTIKAVNEAIATNRTEGAGSLYFYNPKIATSHWLDSLTTTVIIGNHVFKK